jgi:amidohydrolase
MREVQNEEKLAVEQIESKQALIDSILERSREVQPEMEQWYQDFHEHPELGGEEVRTAGEVKKYLENLGIEIIGEGIGGSGIVARIKGQEGGPTIALRADMDALPIEEVTDHTPRSQEHGKMHGCGHDAHTAGLMGAAKILCELKEQNKLGGDVVLLFQPSEEKAHQKESGAVKMVKFLEENGLRDKIGAFFGAHVFAEEERGYINVKDGVQMASSGEIDIILRGPGGHIMNINELPDLHNVFSKITVRLSEIFQPLNQKQEALVGSARTKYEGSGYNVLPASAESTWVVRVTSPLYKEISREVSEQIKKVVDDVVQEESKNKDTSRGNITVEVKKRHGYRPVVHRDPGLVEIAAQSANATVKNTRRDEKLLMGGEDFSFYLGKLRDKEIPGVFVMVGAANSEKGIPKVPHHSPQFQIDQGITEELAALHSVFTIKTLEHLKKNNNI